MLYICICGKRQYLVAVRPDEFPRVAFGWQWGFKIFLWEMASTSPHYLAALTQKCCAIARMRLNCGTSGRRRKEIVVKSAIAVQLWPSRRMWLNCGTIGY